MKRLFGYSYGALIAGSYLVIRRVAGDQYLLYFSASCVFLSLATLPFLSRSVPAPISPLMIRGILFAVTNILLMTAQSTTGVSTSFAAALIGSSIVSLPSMLRCTERRQNVILLFSLAAGTMLLLDRLSLSYLAVLAGAIQAVTFATAGASVRTASFSLPWHLFAGFTSVAFIGAIMFTSGRFNFDLSQFALVPALIVTATILVSQVAFFALYRSFSTATATRLGLSRVPLSFLLETIVLGSTLPIHTLIGAICITYFSYARTVTPKESVIQHANSRAA